MKINTIFIMIIHVKKCFSIFKNIYSDKFKIIRYNQIFINNKNKNLNLPEINHPFFSLVYYF